MQKNNIEACFNQTNGNTVDLKKECSEFTGLNIRTIQMLYADKNKEMSLRTAQKLMGYFSHKWGRDVQLDEIVIQRNNVVLDAVGKIKETM